jgi:transcriptional regulator with XRE-family HTH domain
MLAIEMMSPEELALALAERTKALRLYKNYTQAGLAKKAGVSLGSLKRFEQSGEIALLSLIRLAIVLEATAELESWFALPEFRSIDDALQRQKKRQRGRI